MRLVIWDTLERRPVALVQELAAAREVDFTWTTDAAAFRAAATAGGHALALVLLRGEPTPEQQQLLREVAAVTPLVASSANPSAAALRSVLALGVVDLFAEPIAPHRLVVALEARLHGHATPTTARVLHPIDPVACHLSVFGRATEGAAHWLAVSRSTFELSTSAELHVGDVFEVTGAPPGLRTDHGVFGRVLRVDLSPGAPSRLRCEAIPVSDQAALSVAPGTSLSGSHAPTGDLRPAARGERLRFDPLILGGLVALLLAAAGLSWWAVARQDTAPHSSAASTREVLDGIQRAFE